MPEDILGCVGRLGPLLLGEGPPLDSGHLNARHVGDQPVSQLVAAGLQGVKPHPLGLALVVGEGHRQGSLAGGGVAAQHHHVPQVHKKLLVQLRQAPGHVLMGRGVAAPEGMEHLFHVHAPHILPLYGEGLELVQSPAKLFHITGLGQFQGDSLSLHHSGLLLHPGYILPDVRGCGHIIHDLEEQLAPVLSLAQPVPDGDRVHRLAADKLGPNGLKDLPVDVVQEIPV